MEHLLRVLLGSRFQKERKEIRLKSLLEACKVPYNVHNVKRDRFQAYIEKDNVPAPILQRV